MDLFHFFRIFFNVGKILPVSENGVEQIENETTRVQKQYQIILGLPGQYSSGDFSNG
jgi:hypothetical protein